MHVFFILAVVFGIIGIVGNWLDGFTTYQGVKKFGPSIEGDKSWLTQFMVKHPWTLLFLEPLGLSIAFSALIWTGFYNGGGFFLTIVGGVMAAAFGYDDAYNNWKINSK